MARINPKPAPNELMIAMSHHVFANCEMRHQTDGKM